MRMNRFRNLAAALVTAAVLAVNSPAMAQTGWTPPDVGFDGAEMATGAGTALGAILVAVIGLAVAFTIAHKFIRWFRSTVK